MTNAIRCLAGPHEGKTVALEPGRPLQFEIKHRGDQAGQLTFGLAEGGIDFVNSSPVESLVDGEPQRRAILGDGCRVQVGKMVFEAVLRETTRSITSGDEKDETAPSLPVIGEETDELEDSDPEPTSDDSKQVTSMYTRSGPPKVIDESEPTPAGGHRTSRRISASRMAAVDAPEPEPVGLLGKVGKVFRRKEEKDPELEQLERQREELLWLAGRRALQQHGGFGLPADVLQRLAQGQTVTLQPSDIAQGARETFRRHAELLAYLDAEIAARREALGLGEDPSMRQVALDTEHQTHQENAFKAMDDMMTDEVQATTTAMNAAVEDEPGGDPSPLGASAGGEAAPASSGRRRVRRRRR